jgi:formate dehydrogenase subunit gamma
MGARELEAHAQGAIEDNVTIEPVYCLGNCACAPAVMINGTTHGRVDAARFDALVGALPEDN